MKSTRRTEVTASPMMPNRRPVFARSAGYGREWNGWTLLSRSHFGARGAYTPRYSVDARRLASDLPFIEHSRPPIAMRPSSVRCR